MNNTIYDFEKKEDKPFFASFFNDASLNITLLLEELKKRFKIKKSVEIDKSEVFLNELLYEKLFLKDIEARKKVIADYLPFTFYLNQIDKENYNENLALFFKKIDAYRNYYTHENHNEIELCDYFPYLLNELKIKTVKLIQRKQFENPQNIAFLKRKFPQDFKNKKESINLKHIFNHLVYTEKEGKKMVTHLIDDHLATTKIDNNQISTNGLLFFVHLFLSKKDNEYLLDNVKGFKGTHELSFLATRWVYSYFSFKEIRKKIITDTTFNNWDTLSKEEQENQKKVKSKETQEVLFTQMVDYLSKCPEEVYSQLSEAQQNEFVEALNEYVQDHKQNSDTQEKATVSHKVIRKRYENRFNYFALRFLDEYANFPSLRFQVALGSYVKDRKEKELPSSKRITERITERIIKKEVKVFGKLSEITTLKQSFHHTEKAKNSTWEEYPNPHYAIDRNTIGIYIEDKGNDDIKHLKEFGDIVTKEKDTPEIFRYTKPTAILSLKELPALLYEFLVYKKPDDQSGSKSGGKLQSSIVGKIKQQQSILKKSLDYTEEEIKKKKDSLPKKWVKHLLEKNATETINFKKLTCNLNTELKKLENREKDFEANIDTDLKKTKGQKKDFATRKDSNLKKRKYLNKRETGDAVLFLANDIKRFMPSGTEQNPKSKQRWKGYLHTEIQRMLSFYDAEKENLKDLFDYLDVQKEHPFIETLLKNKTIKNTTDFYGKYLEALRKYLKDLDIDEIEKAKSSERKGLLKKNHPYFKKKLYTKKIDEAYFKEIQGMPTLLNRGLFDKNPTYIKKEDDKTPTENNNTKKAEWFTASELNTETFQKFYSYKRHYGKSVVSAEISNLNIFKEKFQLPKEDYKALLNNERAVRLVARQDFFTLKMVNYMLLHDIFESAMEKADYTLNDIYLTPKERLTEIQKVQNQHQLPKGTQQNSTPIKSLSFYSKEINHAITIEGVKLTTRCKLKDVGKFRSYQYNTLVHQMMETYKYVGKETISEETLKKELESYQRNRRGYRNGKTPEQNVESVFAAIHQLEKAIDERTLAKDTLLKDGNPNFSCYLSKIQNWVNEEDREMLIFLRNAFSHNKLFADGIKDKTKEDIERITEQLKTELKEKNNEEISTFFAEKVRYLSRKMIEEVEKHTSL